MKNSNYHAVLATAVFRAAGDLGLTPAELVAVLHYPSEMALADMEARQSLDPASLHGEAAIRLIRVARALVVLLGGNRLNIRYWMRTSNIGLGGSPIELMTTDEGLANVDVYLDIHRNRGGLASS